MRVLFLSHYFPPEGNAPANRVFEMCRRWVRTGHSVTVVTGCPNVPAGKPYAGYRNRWRFTEILDGIRVVRVWTCLAPNRGRVRRILNYLSYLVTATLAGLSEPRPDVVVATSPQFFCAWAGALVSRFRRLPFVLEIRDIWPESISTVGAMTGPVTLSLLEKLERRLYAAAEQIVTVGDGYRQRLIERGVPAGQIAVITNGIAPETWAPRQPDAALRATLGPPDAFVCAFVGTIGMACGLDVVLRAAQLLRTAGRNDIRFALVGDGAVRQELETEARRLQLGNVVFTGLQPHGRMPDYLAASNACLVHLKNRPLFESVLPSKIFEAAAMARPVILGVKGHAAQLVESAGAGLCIPPEDEQALSRAVIRLADNREEGRRMGEAGRRWVLERFTLDELAARYGALLESLASKSEAADT
jgi:glycosyltransferase involved in cell wall biosynthesis